MTAPPDAADARPQGANLGDGEDEMKNGSEQYNTGGEVDNQPANDIGPGLLIEHVSMLHRLASAVPGTGNKLVVSGFGQDPDVALSVNNKGETKYPTLKPINLHFEVGDVDGTLKAIETLRSERHRNVYMPLSVYGPDLLPGQKGTEAQVIAMLGLVVDFDDADAHKWEERLPLPPDYVVQTSAGRFQCFYLFNDPVDMGTAKAIAERLKEFTGGDFCSSDMCHVWRVPGCLNWPNRVKVHRYGRGREPQPVEVVVPCGDLLTTVADLDKALPPLSEPVAKVKTKAESLMKDEAEAETTVTEAVRENFDPKHYLDRRSIALYGLLTAPVSADRSAQFYGQVAALVEKHPHLTDGEVALILRQANTDGAWRKYLEPNDRVVQEVNRARANLEMDQSEGLTLMECLEQSWVYVSSWKRFFKPETGDLVDKEGMTDHYADDLDKMASRLLSRKSFRKVLRVDYLPGEPQIVGEVLNQWRPSGLEPVPGDVSLFTRHMELLVPVEWERNHLLDCCAFILQFPGRKLRQAVLIQGRQRVGTHVRGGPVSGSLEHHHHRARLCSVQPDPPAEGQSVALLVTGRFKCTEERCLRKMKNPGKHEVCQGFRWSE
jgi:hypothetical protein